eukprot:6176129-Pleurochrysis_carterae.AAC.1
MTGVKLIVHEAWHDLRFPPRQLSYLCDTVLAKAERKKLQEELHQASNLRRCLALSSAVFNSCNREYRMAACAQAVLATCLLYTSDAADDTPC